ncbi:probable myosin-binding protein 4 isoform X1 [Ziziphus jujuba]|nr:probable myosin-binding protein 4 isoform X1 [Ziziphus jujuba]
MEANGNSSIEVYRNLQGFIAILTSAACEWVLIFLLLIDAVLSYLLKKFADYCNLQRPCILCSRLDHVIGNENNTELYQNLLCSKHISDLSSLISCRNHGKLADGRGMCEDCLFSFTTKNKANAEMHRVLEAKLEADIGGSGFQSSFLNMDSLPGFIVTKRCSCCNKPWNTRQSANKLLQLKSSESKAPKPNIPLPQLPGHSRLQRRDNLKKIRNKFRGSVTTRRLGKSGFDPMSYVGYRELKINSDSETEIPWSDDDIGRCNNQEGSEPVEDFIDQCTSDNIAKEPSSNFNTVKPTNCSYILRPFLSDPTVQHDISKAYDVKSLASHVSHHDYDGKLDWQQVNQKPNTTAFPEIISLDEISPPSELDELYSQDNKPSFVVAPSSEKYVSRVSDLEHASIDKHKEVLKSTSISAGPSTKIDWVVNDTTVINAKNSDIFDVCENESSCVIEPIMKEPHAVDKKSKPLSLRNSLGQECSFSSKNTSPGRDAQDDEVQITDASNSNEIQMLRKSVSVESGLESLDRSNVTEIEGENIVDRLQRQVEHDKRRMAVLFKELEAERNASEIATNQAMAMITRLQEEKAALHMEALQYLRMMEEQAEYDVEALEKANDLLAEKEKEIQDMEAELEFYRLNFPDEIKSENFHGGYDMKSKNDAETPTVVCRDNISIPCNSITTDIKACGKTFAAKTPCLEFEDERLYISQHLQCLEKKLCQIFRNGTFSNMANGDHSKKLADDGHKGIGSRQKEEILLNNHIEEYLHDCNGSTTSPEDGSASDDDDCYCLSSNGNNHFDSHSQTNCVHQSRIDLVALGNEISDLNDRLEALETDNDFLEHMLNSIQHGNEGLQFVQEVAHQLQELRKTWIGLRSQSVP